MSGTSLDGVDGVLADFPQDAAPAVPAAASGPPNSSTASSTIGSTDGSTAVPTVGSTDSSNSTSAASDPPPLPTSLPGAITTLASAYIPFPPDLRARLLALQVSGPDEIEREALAANELARSFAECVRQLLAQAKLPPGAVRAVGVHGQTVRHRPELGFTRQTNNPALLAELCGIDTIADFRSRDVAAGGQGAPLVPAFHQAVFGQPGKARVVLNLGGIANISVLAADGSVGGFDTGPGNVLLDGWVARHLGKEYDAGGAWGGSGAVLPGLLESMLREPYFALPPPKSTGRDLFHMAWLARHLAAASAVVGDVVGGGGGGQALPPTAAADVQATLMALTAETVAEAVARHAPGADAVYVCGGGACNGALLRCLEAALRRRGQAAGLFSSTALGVEPNQVEALAFAWLAQRFTERLPGNLPAVTGARGLRILVPCIRFETSMSAVMAKGRKRRICMSHGALAMKVNESAVSQQPQPY